MTHSMIGYLCLLVHIPSRLSSVSGSEIVSKSVCHGDAVQLFSKVAFINGSVVSIYINGETQILIGTGNSSSTFSIMSAYKHKMFLDELQTFWIRKIQRSDEQKYILRSEIDTMAMKDEVQIFVMVAPTKHCIPKLLKMDSALIASLESDECGNPSASVKFLDYPGISYMDTSMVKLPAGKESGIYYACTASPALKCVRNFKISDYCSSYVVEANNTPAMSLGSTEILSEMIVIIVIVMAILLLVICTVVNVKLVLQNKEKRALEALSREKGMRDMSYVPRRKQGNYRRARGYDDDSELLVMEVVPSVETKSVKFNQSKGPAAPGQTRFKTNLMTGKWTIYMD